MGGRGGSGSRGGSTPGGIKNSSIKKLENMGATRWTKNGKDRLYLNSAGLKIIGLETETYKNGSIMSAKLKGESISNSKAGRIGSAISEAYVDLNTGKIFGRGEVSDFASDIRKALKK